MDRIKAHRSAPDVYDPPTFDQMADRIEELEAACWRMKEDRDRAIGWSDHDTTRAQTAETKLAKAVEAIKEIKAIVASSKVPIAGQIRHQCKVALAELEGK
jgi:hypothetical protein